MTIRAKLYAAIVLTVIGPLATTAVALHGMAQMGDAYDDVRERHRHESIALQLKYGVTDVNGWQTAYGYDSGESRPVFLRAVDDFRAALRAADRALTDPRERELIADLNAEFDDFMGLDAAAWRELQAGREGAVRRIFLGPEIERFRAMAATAQRLATYEGRRARETDEAFDDARREARRRMIAVALGAALVIVLLLVTASDVARLALDAARREGRVG